MDIDPTSERWPWRISNKERPRTPLGATQRFWKLAPGSGYAAAILSRIAKEVFTIERHQDLATSAGERLKLSKRPKVPGRTAKVGPKIPDLIRQAAEPFSSIGNADLQPLLERIGDARLVLIGEASHGTSEFYRIRAEITKATC